MIKKLLALCILIAHFPLQAKHEQPYVTCELKGQLGNQLFEIAATLAYAWDYDLAPIFPELNHSTWNIPYNRKELFFRLDASPLPRPPLNVFWESTCYQESPQRPSVRLDHYLHGYFQSWLHFHHHREKLLEIFAPSNEVEDYLENKYAEILNRPDTVAIHVRTYDNQAHDFGMTFLGLEYYEKAMNFFPEETLFILFSDRINWCKHHFTQFNKNIVYIDGNNHIQDLFLMAKLKHHIIANSTFSWWGAYLNTNPDQIVITPRYWLHPNYRFPLEVPNFFFLPHWKAIETDRNIPYPEDMRQYDSYSKSIDNQ